MPTDGTEVDVGKTRVVSIGSREPLLKEVLTDFKISSKIYNKKKNRNIYSYP